ncbi:MAG: hypothetical protein ACK2T3_07365 [Candidatus Promineifilaceae bacterium]
MTAKAFWAGLGLLFLIGAVILILSPEERELGSGIRSVYVHVALTWTGMSGIAIAGLIGLASAVLNNEALQRLGSTIIWVALIFLGLGLIMSLIAGGINWGAVFWQEPRSKMVFQLLAVGLFVQGVNAFPIPFRLKGILQFMLPVVMAVLLMTTPLVLHPGNAATTSESSAIRFTFIGLYGAAMAGAAWIVLAISRRQ